MPLIAVGHKMVATAIMLLIASPPMPLLRYADAAACQRYAAA